MTQVPLIPDNAPFSAEQRAWLNGFLAGLFSRAAGADISTLKSEISNSVAPLTILYGSQTGTAEGLAKKVAKEAGKRGFAPMVLDMAQTDPTKLAAEKNVLVLASTYGDGEPPDNARALHRALGQDTAPALTGVRFSVCALGDRNYAQFCRCGIEFDQLLEKRGATRLAPRAECDVDYEEPFTRWLDTALSAFNAQTPSAPSAVTTTAVEEPQGHDKSNPFPAPVLAVRRLSGAGSAKEVNHVEFSLAGSGLTYEAGDALGVVPQNCPDLVAAVLTALGADGEEPVPTPAGERPLRTALHATYCLGKPTPELLALCGVTADATRPHVVDVLLAPGARRPGATEFVKALRRLQPRLYSISSSPKAHPEAVHLTVGAVRYEAHGRARKGVCSTFLAERATAVGTVGVFVHHNKAFRPPADARAPMIMIGPGTGIAPFRAFLEERQATGATGENWLFFGDQREADDFLYRDELLALQNSGVLHRLDLAWSRDQAAKIYVQTRMLEAADDLWRWLERGAHVYVCGDASRMAKDVDAALHTVIRNAGGRTEAEAVAYVDALKTAKRYQRDVY